MKNVVLAIIVFLWGVVAEAQNRNISNGNVFDGEPYIAVNPSNPRHMVVAWMGYVLFARIAIKTKVTFDGGRTWSPLRVIPHVRAWYSSADPSLAFDRAGNVFLSFIDYGKDSMAGAVVVVKSSDGGLTWGGPVEVIRVDDDTRKPIDRPWIAIDRSGGPYDGNMYVTSIPPTIFGYVPPPYHPYLSVSTDGGASFQWRYLDTAGWLAGNLIRQPMAAHCVGPNGTLYAVYPSYVYAQNPLPQFILAASDDGGRSFSYHTVFAASVNPVDSLAKAGYKLLADPTDSAHLVFIYPGMTYGDLDIFIRESFDGGTTWGAARRVNDDAVSNGRMQDMLWGDFDDDGDLVIAWRDRRNGSGPGYATAYEIWGAYRHKDSLHFAPNFRISDTLIAYDSVVAYAGNDFMCVQVADDTLVAVWGDTRNGKLNIWFQRMAVGENITGMGRIHSETQPLVRIYPNPVSATLRVEGRSIDRILIYNLLGECVGAYGNPRRLDLRHLPVGIYVVEVHTPAGIVTRRISRMP